MFSERPRIERRLLISPEEQDISEIYASDDPFDKLQRVSEQVESTSLSEHGFKRLLEDANFAETRRSALTTLSWYCLTELDRVAKSFRDLGIEDSDILASGFLYMQETFNDSDIADLESLSQLKIKVRKAVRTSLRDLVASTYGVPITHAPTVFKYFDSRKRFVDIYGREAGLSELPKLIAFVEAEGKRHPKAFFTRFEEIHGAYMDMPTDEHTISYEEMPVDKIYIDYVFTPEQINQLLEHLTPDQSKVVRLRHFENNMTLKELGQVMGVTRERIRQIESMAFRKIRRLPAVRAMSGFITWETAKMQTESSGPELSTTRQIVHAKSKHGRRKKQHKKGPSTLGRLSAELRQRDLEVAKEKLSGISTWSSDEFNIYLKSLLEGKAVLLKPGDYPDELQVSETWEHVLLTVRDNALFNPHRIFFGMDRTKGEMRFADYSRFTPKHRDPRTFLYYRNHTLRKQHLDPVVADIFPERWIPAGPGDKRVVNIDRIYNFLTDTQELPLYISTIGDRSYMVGRTTDTFGQTGNKHAREEFRNNSFTAAGLLVPRNQFEKMISLEGVSLFGLYYNRKPSVVKACRRQNLVLYESNNNASFERIA